MQAGKTKPRFAPVLALLIANRVLGMAFVGVVAVQVALVALRLPAWPCPFHAVTGLSCPGCGLSRAVHCLFEGEWAAAMEWHPFAPFFVGLGVLVAAACLLPGGVRRRVAERVARAEARTGVVMIPLVLFAVYGVVRLLIQARMALL